MPTAEAAPSTHSSTGREPDGLQREKTAFRAAAVARRAQAAARAAADAGQRLADRFVAAIPITVIGVVSGYVAIGDEIDPAPLLRRLAAAGRPLCLPVTPRRGQPLSFRLWRPGDPLVLRPMGLLEPGPEAPAAEPDLLLVPLLAFDAAGRRMGYGGGFYDRTLAGLRAQKPVRAVGIAFEAQMVERVPAGPTDALLDAVVTEAAFRSFAPAGG